MSEQDPVHDQVDRGLEQGRQLSKSLADDLSRPKIFVRISYRDASGVTGFVESLSAYADDEAAVAELTSGVTRAIDRAREGD